MTPTPSSPAAFDAFAEIYDRADIDRSPEIGFYRSLLGPQDHHVLELGCGTGTMLIGMAAPDAQGVQPDTRGWVGLDLAEGMLAVARQRAPHMQWLAGDMCAPPVAGPFDWVLCCFHTLQLVLSDADLAGLMRAVAQRLRPGGRFAFDVYLPNLAYLSQAHPVRVVRRFEDGQGQALEVREHSHWQPDTWVLTTRWCLHPAGAAADAPPLREMTVPMRQYFPADLEQAVAQAGLTVEARYGFYDRRPLAADSLKQVMVCRKP
jgi:SAM-dependent methyltransferase